jgi:tetratricopeptide (TPR) repeat protein
MKKFTQEIQELLNLYRLKKISEAEKRTKESLDNYPNNVWLHNFFGLILIEQKKFKEAITCYEKAIKIDPNFPMIYNNLGIIYKEKKEYKKSAKYYKQSIDVDSKIPEPENNLGNLYRDLNENNKAIERYVNAINKNPNFLPAYYNLGITYKSLGNFDKARFNLEKAIEIDFNFYPAHRNLSEIIKYSLNHKHFLLLNKIYDSSENKNINKKEIAFALGKAYEDIKNYKKSFELYLNGNNLHRKTISFSIQDEIKEFDKIKESFISELYKDRQDSKNKNNIPIFILGMPRSGTTLVEQIISSHPDVYGGDELNIIPNIIKKEFYKNNSINLKNISSLSSDELYKMSNEYILSIKKIAPYSKKITDKLPVNFKWIGLIKLILPNAVVIHCSRNAKDTCLSIFKNYFVNSELNYAYNLDELSQYYNLYTNLINYWKKILPNFIHEAVYENIIANPDKEIKKLIKNCNLKWDENCLNFHKNKRVVKTSSDTQVRKKIYKTSFNKWKNYNEFMEKFFNKLT